MRSSLCLLTRLIAFVLLIHVSALRAADSTQSVPRADAAYSGERWTMLDAKAVMEEAGTITTASYPGNDAVTVDQRIVYAYRPDGTGEVQDESYVKVLTEKGKDNNRVISHSFMIPYTRLDFVLVEVIHADGRVERIDIAANSKESIDDSQMEMNIYDPNMKVLSLSIPQLTPGDTVHQVCRSNMVRPIFAGQFCDGQLLEGMDSIRHLSVEVHAPAGKDLLHAALRDAVPGTVRYSTRPDADGGKVHLWEATQVPRMVAEPAMPPGSDVLQRVLISTIKDWQEVSRWYAGLCEPHLEAVSPEMRKTVEELTKGADGDLQKLRTLFYWVSKNIRYMGVTPEKDRPGFEPHDVSITFEKKYGVCRDKAALLVSMLRLAGIKAWPVLISVGPKRDSQVPDIAFNHAIVAANLGGSDYQLMDPTDENTVDLLPANEANLSYVVCRPEGEDLMRSPVRPAEENMAVLRSTGTLDVSGHLEVRSELHLDGINDNAFRAAFARMKPDDRRRLFENFVTRGVPGSTLTSLKLLPEDMLDTSVPVSAVFEFSADGAVVAGSGRAVLSMPWLGKNFGIVNYILSGASLESRKYPLQTYVACGIREELEIRLVGGYGKALSLPTSKPVNNNCFSYSQSFSQDGDLLKGVRDFRLKSVEFTPEQYQGLRAILRDMQWDERKSPVVSLSGLAIAGKSASSSTPQPVSSDLRMLEDKLSVLLIDAHNSVSRLSQTFEVLSYNGKKDASELKIPFNPACQSVKLIKAAVTGKDAVRHEISADEVHEMDAGWTSSAVRYPPGKILVANLPGVEIGSTIELEYEVKSFRRPFIAPALSFQGENEILSKSLRLQAPERFQVDVFVSEPSARIKETHGNDALGSWREWSVGAMEALPSESQTPPDWTYLPGLSIFAGDESAYLHELSNALLLHAGKSAKATTLSRELASSSKDQLGLLRAIRDHVAISVRGAGPAFHELPLSSLSDADTTLADGYGHAADQAILLHAMLEASGFKPEFVLSSDLADVPTLRAVADRHLLPRSFQNVLVRVQVGGETYYLNDTDQYACLGSTTQEGRLAILLPTGERTVIEATAPARTRTEVLSEVEVGDDGKTSIQLRRSYYGNRYREMHRYYAEVTSGDRAIHHQQLVSAVAQGARAVGPLKSDFDSYPGVEEFAVEVDRYAIVDGSYAYFTLPISPRAISAPTDSRTLPLYVSQRENKSYHAEIQLPKAYGRILISPLSQNLIQPAGAGSVRVESRAEAGRLTLDYVLQAKPAIVPPADYAKLRQIDTALQQKAAKLILLEQGGPGNN